MASNLLRTISHRIGTIGSVTHTQSRGYITRAHPKPLPTIPIDEALQQLLETIKANNEKRKQRWENNLEKRIEQRAAYLASRDKNVDEFRKEAKEKPYREMDETISLALALNLDPRKPGQSLRGSIALPHGNGKTFSVAVFTEDPATAQAALDAGAAAAGGQSLIESIKNGTTPITSFQRTLATPDMVSSLSPIARLLGPRGLMPNPKLNTIQPNENMLEALAQQQSGLSNYRTDKSGIIRLGLGRGSFGLEKLMDNIREFMNEVQGIKPESFGKGKKKGKGGAGKGAKYYLKAYLSSTQSAKGILVDMKTLDPTSSFFMSSGNL
mmetsp:Transcript_13613/g.28845  ORF Transcript_13613/g.28845 Transcript_13613/m.28845 type:complete len:325 (-) Transcript_13613:199-1173(-)|eukprot:CAMPEP_0171421204 /NCGR_PEP_ID=MMETSP0881-20121228/476_1 /TAXON_ID=67004 /ORGANISM="Thalassiosira weissflogii, Strain CCMP1336" /LENGTH=324 /DNA_ID=CAMNT_0011939613 /DNA_START=104 /DNA_END=1078 /DNA_ORIENTATION=+